MKKPIFDLQHLTEDQRIELMVESLTKGTANKVGNIVDDEAKADRYIEKIKALDPTLICTKVGSISDAPDAPFVFTVARPSTSHN